MRLQVAIILMLSFIMPTVFAQGEVKEAVAREFVLRDWLWQDFGQNIEQVFKDNSGSDTEQALVQRVLSELPDSVSKTELQKQFDNLKNDKITGSDNRWRELYINACTWRREIRLQPLLTQFRQFIYMKHFNLRGSHYAYTEAQSDAQAERNYIPGSAMCKLTMNGVWGESQDLITDPNGVVRDPDVSWDGNYILFSWKKSDREDDYHLYEMDTRTGEIRQITFGLGFADYEGVYLPNDDIVFNSTRCVQIVDCWWTEVSNLYTCKRDGSLMRRLSFDQVHTNFPQVLADGRVVYTRWDYNDRGQIFPQALFQMNSDGTAQTEYYGNNSYFPTTLIHARGIPNSDRLLGIATGHHSDQSGKLCIIDRNLGQQENQGITLIAPVRETPADRIDDYGQFGDQFAYPYPIDDDSFLITFAPAQFQPGSASDHYGVYLMDIHGNRELLAWDASIASCQSVPLAPRQRPHVSHSAVDYSKATGIYRLQDIYAGPGLQGIKRGTIKKLRVIALDYRAAGVRSNSNAGPAGGAMVSTPVAVCQGTWDVKKVLGDVDVNEDGSAVFEVPARTPLYFQALDENNRAVQTMRSWSTLQPGETFSCVGCHETRGQAPLSKRTEYATQAKPKALKQFYGETRGFSFIKEIQPILDKHCISCHNNRDKRRDGQQPNLDLTVYNRSPQLLPRGSEWKYTTQRPEAEWNQAEFSDADWQTGKATFGMQGTPGISVSTPWLTPDIWMRKTFNLTESLEGHRIIGWEFHDEDIEVFINGTLVYRASGYVMQFTPFELSANAAAALRKGENTIAIHCHQTIGGQGVDFELLDAGYDADFVTAQKSEGVFSLLGDTIRDEPAGRAWSDAYLALTNAFASPGNPWNGRSDGLVNWIGAQTGPDMLPPYYAGAATSNLLAMLESGHHGVSLNHEELDKISCWIDLNIPYCGDYMEANIWSQGEIDKYQHFLQKRQMMETMEQENIKQLLTTK